jgi:chromosomal replication initiation ATPase DnaA
MNAEDAWELAVDELQREMPRGTWNAFVRDTRLIEYQMGCFRVEADSEFARDWLAARLTSTLRRMLTGMMNRAVEIEFVARKEEEDEKTTGKMNDLQPDLFGSGRRVL